MSAWSAGGTVLAETTERERPAKASGTQLELLQGGKAAERPVVAPNVPALAGRALQCLPDLRKGYFSGRGRLIDDVWTYTSEEGETVEWERVADDTFALVVPAPRQTWAF